MVRSLLCVFFVLPHFSYVLCVWCYVCVSGYKGLLPEAHALGQLNAVLGTRDFVLAGQSLFEKRRLRHLRFLIAYPC
jgi:hypothetical protein